MNGEILLDLNPRKKLLNICLRMKMPKNKTVKKAIDALTLIGCEKNKDIARCSLCGSHLLRAYMLVDKLIPNELKNENSFSRTRTK